MNCDDLRDLIVLHAAGAADESETRAVLSHLATLCPVCIGRLAEAEAAMAHLPLALDPVAPSPAVRDRLMARVADDAARRPRLAGAPGTGSDRGAAGPGSIAEPGRGVDEGAGSLENRRPIDRKIGPDAPRRAGSAPFEGTGRARSFSDLWLRPALAAALAAGITGLAVYLPMERSREALEARLGKERSDLEAQMARYGTQLEGIQSELRAATDTIRMLRSPAVQVVSLGGAETQPRAAGRIFWDRARRQWRFYAADLKPPGAGKTYELWFITADQKKIPAGTFDVDEAGEGELTTQIPEGVGPLVLAAVTDEPAGGVPQPTGQIHLLGKLSPATS